MYRVTVDDSHVPVPVSDLSGPTVLWTQRIGEELRALSGAHYGRSRFEVDGLGTVLVDHYVDGVADRAWPDVARQRLFVWARLDYALLAGAQFLHPYVDNDAFGNATDEYLVHPEVWYAKYVARTDDRAWGRSVATALYAHVISFGYEITRSDAVTGGNALWDRMDRRFDELADEPSRQRQAALDEAQLDRIYTGFRPLDGLPDVQMAEPLSERAWGFQGDPFPAALDLERPEPRDSRRS